MKIFHCDHCEQLVFFENTSCVNCKRVLAYAPDKQAMISLEPANGNEWINQSRDNQTTRYRLCQNAKEKVCNWAVPQADVNTLCQSCRLTRVIPDLSVPNHRVAWGRLEEAKRRLIYTLIELHLPLANRIEDPKAGLAFEFLADSASPEGPRVLTGHDEGLITVNVAEADDVERETRRVQMHEPYRTLLGHFRHEIGHYYWDRLIRDTQLLDGFRNLFGDDRADYAQALKKHYDQGAPPNWQENYISTYATTHPWEDWAETWAHYLHMVDTLETTASCGLSLHTSRRDEPQLDADEMPQNGGKNPFDRMIAQWYPVTYVLNNLNRSLGLSDGYPFVLSTPVTEKLRFIHECIDNFNSADCPHHSGS